MLAMLQPRLGTVWPVCCCQGCVTGLVGMLSPPTLVWVLGKPLQLQSWTGDPQVPAMPPQGPQHRFPLTHPLCPEPAGGLRAARSKGAGYRSSALASNKPQILPPASLQLLPSILQTHSSPLASPLSSPHLPPPPNPSAKSCPSQKQSIPLHCSLLVSSAQLQPLPALWPRWSSGGTTQGMAAFRSAGDRPLPGSKPAKKCSCGV